MRKWLAVLRPSPWAARRLLVLAALVGVGVGAFCWGRHGAAPRAEADPPGSVGSAKASVPASPGYTTNDYSKRVVAYVYDNIPVAREELGEYLIARFGQERVEFLVNRKIVELACQAKGVQVTDGEVEAQLQEDIKSFGGNMKLEDFVNQVLRRFNKTLYEWKEDVIRPKLAMSKLVRPTIVVLPKDIEEEFEARYGAKVECRMLVLQKDYPQAKRTELWERVRKSEEEFMKEAGTQFIPELAMRKGEVPPIHKHFPDAQIEKEAFSLQPGQVSSLIQVRDGTLVILRCVKHIPPDQSKRIEDERMKLSAEIFERKLAMRIPEVFQQMRKEANPRIVLSGGAQAVPPAVSTPKVFTPPAAN
jgi:hypothetical protein